MSARRRPLGSQPLTTGRALVLGAVQGPAELLPVSSSAHITLLPWFAGWGWDRLDPAARKDFEVALHAGTLAALVVGQRRVIARAVERTVAEFSARLRDELNVDALIGDLSATARAAVAPSSVSLWLRAGSLDR